MRAPSKTVTTGGAAGAAVIIIVWLIGAIWPGVDIPAEVSAAMTVIISSAAAWIVPDPDRRPARH